MAAWQHCRYTNLSTTKACTRKELPIINIIIMTNCMSHLARVLCGFRHFYGVVFRVTCTTQLILLSGMHRADQDWIMHAQFMIVERYEKASQTVKK